MPDEIKVSHLKGENGPDLWHEITLTIPGAIIAGGCIRDYLLDVQPKDIDIFVSSADFPSLKGFKPLPENIRKAEYQSMPIVDVIQRGRIAGYNVDLIGINLPLPFCGYDLTQTFDFAIARCWYEVGNIIITDGAAKDMRDKTVTMLLTDREERSIKRFNRFNKRHGGDYTLVIP